MMSVARCRASVPIIKAVVRMIKAKLMPNRRRSLPAGSPSKSIATPRSSK